MILVMSKALACLGMHALHCKCMLGCISACSNVILILIDKSLKWEKKQTIKYMYVKFQNKKERNCPRLNHIENSNTRMQKE